MINKLYFYAFTICSMFLSFNTVASSDSFVQDSIIYNYGNVLFYTPTRKEKCDSDTIIPKNFLKVAVSPDLFFNSAVCGACVKGEITFDKNETLKFNGVVNNVFKGFYYGDIAINKNNTHGDAVWPVKWRYVKCPKDESTDTPTPKPTPKSTHKPPIREPAGSTCKNAIMHLNGKACCPKTCKVCGNANCQDRPGGAGECCYTGILKLNNVSCKTNPAPCIIKK